MLLDGADPRRSPDVEQLFLQLGKAAFDADLIGAWDQAERPYVFEAVGGQYRFRRA